MTPRFRVLALSVLLAASVKLPAQNVVQPAASASIPTPQHPATADQIREYFNVINLDRTVHQLMDQMVKAMQATSAPYYPASVWEDMHKSIGEFDILGPMVPIYQKYVSQEDMAATLAFYRSDAGQRLLAAQPVMAAESQTIFPELGRKIGEEVARRHLDEIIAAKKKYDDDIAAKQNSSKKQ